MQVHLCIFVVAGQLNPLLLWTFEVLVFSYLTFLTTNGSAGRLILNIWWHFVPALKMVYSKHFSVIHSQSTVNKCNDMTEKNRRLLMLNFDLIKRDRSSLYDFPKWESDPQSAVHLCNWSKCLRNVLGLTCRHLIFFWTKKRARLNEYRLLFITFSLKPSLFIILQS